MAVIAVSGTLTKSTGLPVIAVIAVMDAVIAVMDDTWMIAMTVTDDSNDDYLTG